MKRIAILTIPVATILGASADGHAQTCSTSSTGTGFSACTTQNLSSTTVNSAILGITDVADNYGVVGYGDPGTGVYGSSTSNTSGIAGGFFAASGGSSSTALAGENSSAGLGLYASSNGGYAGYFSGIVNVAGKFESNGTCEFDCGSDERLKENIAPLKGALNTLLQLKGVTFKYRNPEEQGKNAAGTQVGFVAQDVEKAFPQWVGEDSKGFKTLTIQPNQIAAFEVESIRALAADNEELKARMKLLEAGRRPVIGTNANGVGLAVSGIVIAGAFVVARRKQGGRSST